MAGPCSNRVGAERTALSGHFGAVVESDRKFAGDARADGRFLEIVRRAQLRLLIAITVPEDIRFERAVGDDRGGGGVGAEETVASATLVELLVENPHHRGAE